MAGLSFERMFSFSDLELLGLLLGSIFMLIVFLRLFKVMEKNDCPRCAGRLTRKNRNTGDYLVIAASLGILPFKRYKCVQCGWEGLRWRKHKEVVKGPRP
ncbi:hypothetical protein BH09BAC1_BH09BAC1_27270 [soil metagenome]